MEQVAIVDLILNVFRKLLKQGKFLWLVNCLVFVAFPLVIEEHLNLVHKLFV